MRPAALIVLVGGALLGLTAEAVAYGWIEPARWVPDLLTGWTLLACGAIGLVRRPESRVPWLLTAAGACWFLPNLESAPVGPVAWVAASAATLHRGPLIHALLTFPSGRSPSWLERGRVGVAYVIACVESLAGDPLIQAILGISIVATATWGIRGSIGPARRARAWVLPATIAVGVALVSVAVARSSFPSQAADDATLFAYEAVLC